MGTFWRVKVAESALSNLLNDDHLQLPTALHLKVRPGHCVVLAHWNAEAQLGEVLALCIVTKVLNDADQVLVDAKSFDVALRPNPAGRRYWADREFFKFAPDVVVRYMLPDLFAEAFSEQGQIEFGRVIGAPASSPRSAAASALAIPGYVYLIQSDYGFKIGKTVNIKTRTQLFSVKLPFPIKVLHYAWFEDYSYAERMLHLKFADQRLEGEWFSLNTEDIAYIKTLGEAKPIDGV